MQNFVKQYHYLDEEQLPIIRAASIGSGNSAYYWDARKRDDELVVLQGTITGEGKLVHHGNCHFLPPSTCFFAEIPGNFAYFGSDWTFFYIEFSPAVKQWLDLPLYCLTLSEATQAEMLNFVQATADSELSLYENAQVALAFFLKIKSLVKATQQQAEPLIVAVKEYIDTHYSLDLSLDQLASCFDLPKFQLIRQFEQVFQLTPISYLRKVRISHALDLLLKNLSINEIASQVGYASGNYFSKVFRKEMGMSPSKYREDQRRFGL